MLQISSNTSPWTVVVCLVIVSLALILWTRIRTTLSFHQAIRYIHQAPSSRHNLLEPAPIPYWLPWLGNGLEFLKMTPGGFSATIARRYPQLQDTGIFSLVLGGRTAYFVSNLSTSQAVIKSKAVLVEPLQRDLFTKVLGHSAEQFEAAWRSKHIEDDIFARYLTNPQSTNELTTSFITSFERQLMAETKSYEAAAPVNLYQWLRHSLFVASCEAFMGNKLLDMYPGWISDSFAFGEDFGSFLFGVPEAFNRVAVQRRRRILERLSQWSTEMRRLSISASPDGPAWEECFGSRLNRAQQSSLSSRGLDANAGAMLDAGFTFGMASNVIPAIAWMIFHIVTLPPETFQQVLTEVLSAERKDGSFDVAMLMSQPLLQSVWTETLRMYADILVTRLLSEDIVVPLDESKESNAILRKGVIVFVSTWAAHRQYSTPEKNKAGPSPDIFDAKRFLVEDPETGQKQFCTKAGAIIAFGGGSTMCPGRVFAKQEAIAAVALVLARLDIRVLGFVDKDDDATVKFPSPAKAWPGSGVVKPGGDIIV